MIIVVDVVDVVFIVVWVTLYVALRLILIEVEFGWGLLYFVVSYSTSFCIIMFTCLVVFNSSACISL